MKNKINILRKESKKIIRVLEDDLCEWMLFVFHGKENFTSPSVIPFEFSDPSRGGIKEEGARTGQVHYFSPREMKEVLEGSELKEEISIEKMLDAIKALEEVGYIKETGISCGKEEKLYIITEKGYIFAEFLAHSTEYPGRSERPSDRQF